MAYFNRLMIATILSMIVHIFPLNLAISIVEQVVDNHV